MRGIAIVGKNNEPLYLWENGSSSMSVPLQIKVFASLDYLEDNIVVVNPNGQMPISKKNTRFLGAISDGIYAYITATNIKFLLVSDDQQVEFPQLMQELHEQYIQHIMNPFNDTKGPIQSKRFDERIESLLKDYLQ